jgi:hypothetical protein
MKKETTTKNVAIRNVNSMLKVIRAGGTVTDIKNAKEQENLEYANLVVTAENYVKDYIAKNGTKGFIAERLRDGFIGELVHADNGASYIQAVRGKPYGTVVALKTDKGTVLGMSYIDPEDINKPHPIVGLYIALKRAVDGKEGGYNGFEKRYVKSRARKQIEHFYKRSLTYYHPDVYSHSRGQEGKKVVYENYDEIHKRRAMILGEGK